jgi:hypothetical protein
VEIVGAMTENGADEDFEVGFVEVHRGARPETLPMTLIALVGEVNPEFGAMCALEGRVV